MLAMNRANDSFSSPNTSLHRTMKSSRISSVVLLAVTKASRWSSSQSIIRIRAAFAVECMMYHLAEKQGLRVKPPEREWIRMRRVHRSFSCILKRYIPATRGHVLRAGAAWAIRRSSSCEDLSHGRNRWLVNRVLNAASHSRIITTTLTSTSSSQQHVVGAVGVYGLPIAIQLNAHLLGFRLIEDLFTKSRLLDVLAKSRCPTVAHVRNGIGNKGGLYVSCRPDVCIVQSRHDCRSIDQQIVSYANGYLYHTVGGLAEPLRLTHGARVISRTPGVKYLFKHSRPNTCRHLGKSHTMTGRSCSPVSRFMVPNVARHMGQFGSSLSGMRGLRCSRKLK
jgi:hypothetical protein